MNSSKIPKVVSKLLFTICMSLFSFTSVFAQSFTNGSCDGTIGMVQVPTSWTMASGSTDILTVPPGIAGFTFSAPGAVLSSDGGTFCESYTNSMGYTERFEQVVAGFTIGETYTITFEEANFGSCVGGYCPTETAEWAIFVSGLPSMTSGNILSIADGWLNACVTFVATATTHTIGFEANYLGGGGTNGAAILIDNIQLVAGTPSFTYPDLTLCSGDGIQVPIIGGPITGGFSSSPIGLTLDPITGEIDPSTSSPGIYTITYSPGGCMSDITVEVEIIDSPLADFMYDPAVFCAVDPNPFPIFDTDGDGTDDGALGTFTASPAGLIIDPATGEIDLVGSLPGVYSITNTLPDVGCGVETFIFDITILEAPLADFEFEPGVFCIGELNPSPDFDIDEDGADDGEPGVFTAAPAGLVIDPVTGLIDLGASLVGAYTITNTILDVGCGGDIKTYDIIIIDAVSADFMYSSAIYCSDEVNQFPIFDIDGDGMVDGTAGTFTAGVGLVIDPVTGEINVGASVPGVYNVTNSVTSGGCGDDEHIFNVEIQELPVMTAIADQEVCNGESLALPAFSASGVLPTFLWVNTTGTDVGFGLNGAGNISAFEGVNLTAAPIIVTVSVFATSSNGCVGEPITFNVTIHPTPVVSFFADPYDLCSPMPVTFHNTSTPAGVNCVWNFGDGSTGTGCEDITHLYNGGVFDVSLTVESAQGCSNSVTYLSFVDLPFKPEASFIVDKYVSDLYNTAFNFTNLSVNAVSYEWDFDDASPLSNEIDPTHLYPVEPQSYDVTLWAYSAVNTCYDSATVRIVVNDIILYFMPNTFTPDGDDFNETFKPTFTSGIDPFDFHLLIFNRWGEIVFESFNPAAGWNGAYGDSGLIQDGVYIWQLDFKETMSDKRHKDEGHVTILK